MSQIIRDIQLMGLVALLILVDLLVLTAWYLTDPIRCSRSVGAVVKVEFNGDFVGLKKQVVKQDYDTKFDFVTAKSQTPSPSYINVMDCR